MLEIVLDTETTGIKPKEGHRVVEIGIVEIEMDDFSRTGRTFHQYINPCMPMPKSAFDVHGLSDEFLRDQPEFGEIVEEFLEFIGDKPLVIHNAPFDLGFLNHELGLLKRGKIGNQVVDTLEIARSELPELPSRSLDALCKHFDVDKSSRTKHGALLDSELLADVYFKLKGANDGFLRDLDSEKAGSRRGGGGEPVQEARETRLKPRISDEELRAHAAFVARELGDRAVWVRYAKVGQA